MIFYCHHDESVLIVDILSNTEELHLRLSQMSFGRQRFCEPVLSQRITTLSR